MANNKQQPTTKQKNTEPIKKESVNQKMTNELYSELRGKGYTHEQIKSAWSDTKTPKMTNELYSSLRDKGYTHEQIKAGQYSRENLMPWLTSKDASKTFSSWSKSANDFSTWSNSQPKDWAKWDPAQANKWADILTKNAQQANSILADLKKQGAKAGIEEYDAYQSYADYFTKAAQQLRNNNSSYNSYRDANMYKASDGNYYTYDDVLKMEESLSNEISGMSSLNFRIKSGYGTNGAGLPNFGIEITGEGAKKREKQSELEAMQTWIGEKNKQKDQTSWYADNFRPNMDTGKFYENAVATKEQLEARKTELEKSKPNLQLDYAKVDELGNVYDYDYDAYNDDLEKWNKANAAFYAQYDAAQRDYTYASDPNFRFYSAVKNANVNSPEAKAVIEEGKRRDGIYAGYDSTMTGEERAALLPSSETDEPVTFADKLDNFLSTYFPNGIGSNSLGQGAPAPIVEINKNMYAAYEDQKHADIGTWSEDKLNAYYFLRGMHDDAGADRLAQLTNSAIAEAGIQKEIFDPLDRFQMGLRDENGDYVRDAQGNIVDKGHPILGAAAGAVAGVVVPMVTSIPEYLAIADMYIVTGGDLDKNALSLMPSNLSSRMVGNARNRLNEWSGTIDNGIPVFGGKGAGDVYQLGISILQSALSRKMGGGVLKSDSDFIKNSVSAFTLTQFFASAASNGIFEGLNRGMDPDKALLLGTMNGFAEAIGEVVSLDKLVSIKSSAGARAVLKDVLVQMGIEGSEEAFTTVMNTLADIMVNADNSELEVAIQSYMSQGKSREEAEKQAVKDWLNGVAFDFIGGAVSGGVSAGGANITRNIGTYKGSTQYLMDLAEQTPEGSKSREMLPAIQDEYTKKSQRKKQNRQNISAWHGNQFAQQVSDDLRASNRDSAVKAIENRLAELGETGDLNQKAQVMADALIDGMMGEEAGGWAMTPSADFSANATANMKTVMNELSEARENFTAADYARQNEKWTDEVMKGRFLDTDVLYGNRYATANYQYGRAVERNLNEHLTQITDLETQISEAKKELGRTSPTDAAKRRQLHEEIRTAENALKSHRNAILEDGYNSYSEDQKSASVKIDGTEYKVSGLTMSDGDAKVKLEGANGATQTMSIDDERLPAAFRSLALKVNTLGWAAEEAFRYYKPGTDISAYVNRIQNIRAFASENISHDAFMNSTVVKALGSEALAEFLYSHGQDIRKTAQAEISKKISETKEAIKKAQKEAKSKTGRTTGNGNVDTKNGIDIAGKHYDGIEGMELSETQQAVVRMIEILSDILGINYILFNGDARGVLGVYRQGGTIAVNINAGSYSNGKLVRSLAAETLSHELTHFIEQFAQEEYQALRDAVIDVAFNKDSERFEKAVQKALRNLPANFIADHQKEIQSYVDHGMSRAEAEDALRNDYAIREVVADACTVMLKNSKTVTELARQNMTAAQKVADFIEQTVQKIRSTIEKAFSESDPKYYRDEAKLILDEMERIQQLWDAGLKAATEAYNANEKTASEGGEQMQIAEIKGESGKDYGIGVILDSTLLDNLTETERVQMVKAFIESIGGQTFLAYDKNGDPVNVKVSEKGKKFRNRKGNIVAVNKDLVNKYNKSEIKQESIVLLDELLSVASEGPKTDAMHPHDWLDNNGLNPWDQWTAVVQDKSGSVWEATLQIANTVDGEKVLYDIHPIKKVEGARSLATTSTDNNIAQSESESNTKISEQFQMASDIEETDRLIAVHNKSVSGLKRLLERNVVPFPSIAIKKAGTSHEGFGDVSIVFPRSTIDPQVNRQNRLYSNDAWTPTEPRTEYDVGDMWRYTKALQKELGSEIYNGLRGNTRLDEDAVRKSLENNKGDVFDALKNVALLRYAYLNSIGQTPEIQYKEDSLDGSYKYKNEQLTYLFDNLSEDEINALSFDNTEGLQTVADLLNRQFMEQFSDSANGDLLKSLARKPLYTADSVNPHRIQDAYRNYVKNGNKTAQTIDFYATEDALNKNKAIDEDPGFRKWIEERFGDLIVDSGIRNGKDIFTPSGNRRSFKQLHVPATLDNIVREMQKQQEKGIGVFGTNLRGAATKQYNTIEEMRAESGKLLGERINDEVYDSIMSGFNNRLNEMVDRIVKSTNDISSWQQADSARESLLEAIRDAKSKARMKSMLQVEERWFHGISELADDLWDLRNDVQNMPAPYFEAKPRRVVYPEEALAYILPDNADSDVIKQLKDRNYNVMTYEAGNEQDRLAKLNSVEGSQFQMADNAADDTTFESEERTKAWTDLRAENEILRDATKKLNDELRKMGKQAQQTEARYARDTEKLASQRDKAKAQLKRTTTPETRLNDAKKLAREIVKMTQREAVTTREKQYIKELVDEYAERIKGVADYIAQAGDSIDYDHVLELASDIAQDIVNNAEAEIDDGGATKEMRDQMRAALKNRAIFVPQNVRADTLDWNDFKRQYKDVFTFRDNGLDIDIVYENLLKEIPGLLDPTINNPGDMLNEMAEKWDLLQARYENPFENYENETISHYMNMIIQSALDGTLRQVAPTYADRMNARIAALREQKDEAVQAAKKQGREKLEELRAEKNERIEEVRQQGIARKQEALAKERADKWKRVEATRQYYQEMATRATTRRRNGSTRTRIKKLIADLNTRLTHPTEKRYVPAELVKSTIDILDMIDLDSGRGGVKLMEKIAKLQQQYAKLENDPTFAKYSYDDVVAKNITKMAQVVGDTPLRNMSANQLDVVLQTLTELEHMIQAGVSQKLHNDNINMYESGKNAIKATNGVSANSSKLLGNAADFYFTNTMRPDVVFDRFGGFAKDSEWVKLYNMLNNAQRYGMDLQMKFAQPFEALLKDKENLRKLTSAKEEDLVDIGLKDENGEAIKVTRDFMLFVYMNLFNEDNIRHVMFGGITIPELKEYLSGKGDRGFGKGHRKAVGISERLSALNDAINNATDTTEKARLLEEKDALLKEGMEYIDRLRSNIESKLTAYDRKWVDAWWKFNEMASEAMNQTTFDVYGIKKFMVENYFPIITDKNYVDVPMENIIKDMSLENAGFTKERIHASTPIKMMGLADVINMQANRSAQYAAMMPAVRAFNRIWNTTLPGYSSSLRDTVNSKFGSTGVKFVQNLLSDLQGGRHGDFTIFDRLRGHMAQATLSLNPRVALAQTASFPTAAAELGWRPVRKALARGGKKNQFISAADRELIAKYSSALWFRTKGATGDLADVKNMQQAAHKVMDKMGWAMNWIEFMDGATVGRLWYAAQYYVDEKNPELRKGSDAYYEKVAEAFNRCIERTQPNYTTMQRPELLRNPNPLIRALSMFMTQRLQNQSIMFSAVMKYNKYKSDLATGKNGVTQADVSEMRDRLINAATSQIVAGFTIALFKFLCDGLLHRLGKNYRDDDNELTAESVCLEIANMWAESLVSNVVGGSELYTIAKSIITGDRYYGIELSGVSTFTDAIKDFVSLAQKPSLKGAKKLGQDFCMFFGIPEANAEKIGMALWNWGKDIVTGNGFMESGVERTSAQNARLLTKAYANDDEKKIEKFSAEFKDDDTRLDAVRQNIKDGYVAKKQTISKTEAVELLVKAGMRRKDAEAKVQEWTCEIVTGIPFSKIKDEYMKGNITQARVIELLTKYGGRDRENAAKTARSYACEKDTGHPFNDLKEAYLEGEITRAQLTSALKKYGLMNSTDSEKKATFYDYLKDMPDSKISEQRAVTYMQSVKQTGVTAKQYEDMVLNVDADDSGGYSQKEVGGYIQTHNFTDAQINALWKAFGKTWKTDFYTWEVKVAADATGTGKGLNNGNVSQAELGYYLADQIRAGKMTIEQAEKYWSSLLTTSKKSFSQWAKSKRVKLK